MKKFLTILLTLVCLSLGATAENYPYQSDVLWVTVPSHSDWLYKTGEKATVSVQLLRYGMPCDGIKVDYELGGDRMPADKKGSVVLKDGKATIEIGTMKKPGFRDCVLKTEIDGQKYTHHVKVGFSPEKLQPYTKMPSDFAEFWKETLDKASEVPMKVTKEFCAKYSSEKVDCYLVRIPCYKKNQCIYGYLTMPKKEGKYPVVVSPPGAGIKPMDPMKTIFYAESGCIRLDLEIHGIRPDVDKDTYKDIAAAFCNGDNSYLVNGIDCKENYYMRKVYAGCVRACEYAKTLPNWDGKNLIVQGGSQGGALAIVTAALCPDVTLCVSNHPALSDMAGYLDNRGGGYPHLNHGFNNQLIEQKVKTLAYYDVVNFAKILKCPIFLTWGYNDNTCPPTTSYIVWNVITSKKESLITPINEHWTSTRTRHVQLEWIMKNLK
jgi:cephalosporin-C deacetylase-like acetyl esterase